MSIYQCPEHGRVGPMACCAKASREWSTHSGVPFVPPNIVSASCEGGICRRMSDGRTMHCEKHGNEAVAAMNSTPPAPREPGVDCKCGSSWANCQCYDADAPALDRDPEQPSRVAHAILLGAEGLPPKDYARLARAYLALRVPAAPVPEAGASQFIDSSTWGNLGAVAQVVLSAHGVKAHEWDNRRADEQRDFLLGLIGSMTLPAAPPCECHGIAPCPSLSSAAPVSGEPDEMVQRAAWFKWLCDNPQAAAYTVALVAKNRPFGPKLCATMNSGEVVGVMEDDKQPEYRYAAAPSGGSEVSEAEVEAFVRGFDSTALSEDLAALPHAFLPAVRAGLTAALRAGGPTP